VFKPFLLSVDDARSSVGESWHKINASFHYMDIMITNMAWHVENTWMPDPIVYSLIEVSEITKQREPYWNSAVQKTHYLKDYWLTPIMVIYPNSISNQASATELVYSWFRATFAVRDYPEGQSFIVQYNLLNQNPETFKGLDLDYVNLVGDLRVTSVPLIHVRKINNQWELMNDAYNKMDCVPPPTECPCILPPDVRYEHGIRPIIPVPMLPEFYFNHPPLIPPGPCENPDSFCVYTEDPEYQHLAGKYLPVYENDRVVRYENSVTKAYIICYQSRYWSLIFNGKVVAQKFTDACATYCFPDGTYVTSNDEPLYVTLLTTMDCEFSNTITNPLPIPVVFYPDPVRYPDFSVELPPGESEFIWPFIFIPGRGNIEIPPLTSEDLTGDLVLHMPFTVEPCPPLTSAYQDDFGVVADNMFPTHEDTWGFLTDYMGDRPELVIPTANIALQDDMPTIVSGEIYYGSVTHHVQDCVGVQIFIESWGQPSYEWCFLTLKSLKSSKPSEVCSGSYPTITPEMINASSLSVREKNHLLAVIDADPYINRIVRVRPETVPQGTKFSYNNTFGIWVDLVDVFDFSSSTKNFWYSTMLGDLSLINDIETVRDNAVISPALYPDNLPTATNIASPNWDIFSFNAYPTYIGPAVSSAFATAKRVQMGGMDVELGIHFGVAATGLVPKKYHLNARLVKTWTVPPRDNGLVFTRNERYFDYMEFLYPNLSDLDVSYPNFGIIVYSQDFYIGSVTISPTIPLKIYRSFTLSPDYIPSSKYFNPITNQLSEYPPLYIPEDWTP
jgi:hypothetical protein